MIDEELAAIEARENAATPAPWDVQTCNRCDMLHLRGDDCDSQPNPTEADRRFISESRTDISALITEVRKLRSIIGGLRRGGCWCEVAIGNPMMNDHDSECVAARKALESAR